MRLFKKVAIVGTGLIGGSLALALKSKKLCVEVIGVSRHRKNLLWAKNKGIIDRGSQDIAIIKDADLVILATPVDTIVNLAPKISRVIRPDCIVSDVGSTKFDIVDKLNDIFLRYVGAHPLAGSQKRGIRNARANLFKDSLCILTPTGGTDMSSLRKVKKLWESVGARTVLIDPQAHDKILSVVSHLPHVVAFSLMNTVPKDYLRFATPSLKDLTRIAASDIEVWNDIVFSNRANILQTIGLFQDCLKKIKLALKRNDRRALSAIFKQAKLKRESIK